MLHANTGIFGFSDVEFFNSRNIRENEANLFAAELLIDDEEVIELLGRGLTFQQAAGELAVPPVLPDFKCSLMTHKGFNGLNVPIYAQSNFLKDMKVGYEACE